MTVVMATVMGEMDMNRTEFHRQKYTGFSVTYSKLICGQFSGSLAHTNIVN